jgi:hypothetical protein
MMMLKDGLYEQVINEALNEELASTDRLSKTAPIDSAEASKILAKYIAEVVEKGFDNVVDNGGDILARHGDGHARLHAGSGYDLLVTVGGIAIDGDTRDDILLGIVVIYHDTFRLLCPDRERHEHHQKQAGYPYMSHQSSIHLTIRKYTPII